MTRPWLSVIGLGSEGEAGLTAGALAALGEATHVVCAERHAGLLPEALLAGKSIHHWPAWHQAEAVLRPLEGQSVAVLGTGEPFHFGVGTSLVRWFGIGALRVFPASSAFDRACARLGLSQQTTPCLSPTAGRWARCCCRRGRAGPCWCWATESWACALARR